MISNNTSNTNEQFMNTPLTSEYNGTTLYYGVRGWTVDGVNYFEYEDELIAFLNA